MEYTKYRCVEYQKKTALAMIDRIRDEDQIITHQGGNGVGGLAVLGGSM